MKKYVIFTIVILLALGLFFCHGRIEHEDGEAPDPAPMAQGIDTVPMLVTQVQKCAKLYTAEYHVHKIVTHDDVLRLKGTVLQRSFNIKVPLGDRKIAIPMDAKLKAYIDFSHFSEQNIERQGDRITILLPDPKVTMTSSKIDQKNVRQYVALTRANFSDAELAEYQQQGRAAIIADIPKMGILETAQENAAKVLVPMLTEMGYHEGNITIAFRKQYGSDDIMNLLKIEN
ncbi:MAG: DUF4230 domain-containing protein [Prevotella sp.]|nr:DUF4230 domain-containing protein [Prevotella sp.]MBR0166428.1 DUF4230 domain-containing protein [Prevotella sp.]